MRIFIKGLPMRVLLPVVMGVMLLVAGDSTKAQLVPLHNYFTNELNTAQQGDSVQFTAMRPLLLQTLPFTTPTLSLLQPENRASGGSFKNRILNGHLFEINDDNLHLFIDPVLSLTAGKASKENGATYLFTKGINIQGSGGSKVQFGLTYYENQAKFPHWIDSSIKKNGVIPGEGIGRSSLLPGYDHAASEGYVSFLPSKHFNAILGYGKNFIGDGYRSLFLSDNSFSYPYLRLEAHYGKFDYTALYSQYTNIQYRIGDTYQRKFSTIHYMNFRVNKRFELGAFEAILWVNKDSTNARGFDLQYLNPVLFLHAVNFSEGSPDNSVIGVNFKHLLFKRSYLYGQLMIDDLNISESLKAKKQHLNNKYGIQLGMWNKDLLNVANLNHRIEYNTVRPFAYGHRIVSLNYTHYNQALAHPLGANFHELVNILSYKKDRWYGEVHSVFALIGEDYNNTLYGNNLWGGEAGVPLLGSTTLQGLRTRFGYNSITAGYTINHAWNTSIKVEAGNRFKKNDLSNQSETFINVGLVTNLSNHYYDY